MAGASAQLVYYPNGAVAPYDPNNAAATAAHLEATAEAGKLINPFGVHATGLYAPLVYGKREAEPQVLDAATGLVTYPNGAVAPFDPNVAVATAQHYAAKAAHGYYPYVGAANVHPAAYLYGRRKREAQVPVSLVTGFAATPYLGFYGHHLAPVVAPFTAHPNGALVPQEPAEVVEARAAHLAAVAAASK